MLASEADDQREGPAAPGPSDPLNPDAQPLAPGVGEVPAGGQAPEFLSNLDRDAWKAIRGFVYQVDLTILRWLALGANEVLELERGEDIDLVATSVLASVRQGRQLEQVKTSARAVSIRSRQVVEMIANARLHLDANPEMHLRFRFTSNGTATKERQLVKGTPPRACLALWEEVRRGETSDEARSQGLTWIRAGLDSVKRPAGLGDDQWRAFQDVRDSDDDALQAFVLSVEWSLAQPDPPQLREVVISKIADALTHRDATEAHSVYRALFEHALSVLVTKGLKRLTPDDLAQASRRGRLSHGVQERLSALFRLTELHGHRLIGIEGTLGLVTDRLSRVEGEVASFRVGQDRVSLDVPPSPQPLSRRVQSVTELGQLLAQHAWVHVTGPIGSGKSELAKRVCSEWPGGRPLWLQLRALSRGEAARVLDVATAQVHPEVGNPVERCRLFWTGPERVSLLVLDDLPEEVDDGTLAERLVALAASAHRDGGHLLTTGAHRIPVRLARSFALDAICEFSAPPLSEGETAEVLSLHDCPSSRCSSFTGLVRAATQGDPTLVDACVRFIASRAWSVDEAALNTVLTRGYASAERHEMLRRLSRELSNAGARQLLSRMTLSIYPVSAATVADLGHVAPVVPNPRAAMELLVGPCIQATTDDRWEVAPLLKLVGAEDIPPAAKAGCHAVLAKALVTQATLTPMQLSGAITHFLAAGRVRVAGVYLMQGLAMLNARDGPDDDGLLTSFFAGSAMPADLRGSLGVVIRAYQLRIRVRLGRDVATAQADLDASIAACPPGDQWSAAAACLLAYTGFHEAQPAEAVSYVIRAFAALEASPPPAEFASLFDTKALLMLFGAGRNAAEVGLWTEWGARLASLSADQAAQLRDSDHFPQLCVYVSSAVWMAEAGKSGVRDWTAVRAKLLGLRRIAQQHGWALLEASAVRALVVVHAEYESDMEGALTLAREALGGAGSPQAEALVREAIGWQYCRVGDHAHAMEWLSPLEGTDATGVEAQVTNGLLYLAVARSGEGLGALSTLERAVALAEGGGQVPELTRGQARGELAIAAWLLGNHERAVEEMDLAYTAMAAARSDADAWKSTMATWGHISGFMVSVLRTGAPPQDLADGPYVPPRIGMLAIVNTALATRYDPNKEDYLLAHLAMMALSVGDSERAEQRALESLELARGTGDVGTLSVTAGELAFLLIEKGRFREAALFALDASRALMLVQRRRLAGLELDALQPGGLSSLTPAEQADAESGMLFTFGLLMVCQLVRSACGGGRELAHPSGAELVDLFDELSRTGEARDTWEELEQATRSALLPDSRQRRLLDTAHTAGAAGRPNSAIACYLLSTITADANLATCAQAHAVAAEYLSRALKLDGPVYGPIVGGMLLKYWTQALTRERFRFRVPAQVESELASVRLRKDDVGVREVLRIVGTGLGVTWASGIGVWLHKPVSAPDGAGYV